MRTASWAVQDLQVHQCICSGKREYRTFLHMTRRCKGSTIMITEIFTCNIESILSDMHYECHSVHVDNFI